MKSSPFEHLRVAVRGGGDLGSGVAYRLWRCGFPILVTELAQPLLIRSAVAFGSAILKDSVTIEGITARRVDSLASALDIQAGGEIPVAVDIDGRLIEEYRPNILVDARMLKTDPGRPIASIPLVIGLGPGFDAPTNCDAVIETRRGHTLGRVIRQGRAMADTREPEKVLGKGIERVLRAPADGVVKGLVPIGAMVEQGQTVLLVNDQPIAAPCAGAVRGLAYDGLNVQAGNKIADIDPRGEAAYCFAISDKALAVGGGVLEAILSASVIWDHLKGAL